MEADFSGYATKAGLRCRDGRTITPQAFQHMDKMTVPLVWQHGHNSPENVLGHAILEARADGVYAYGYFNDTKSGEEAKKLVQHKDIKNLSIFANDLVEKTKQVLHGVIREVSLVLAGANPGALIDQVRLQHGDDPDDVVVLEDTAIIHTGVEFDFLASEATEEELVHADTTARDIYESMSPEQKDVLHLMLAEAVALGKKQASAEHSATDGESLEHGKGPEVTHNIFEQQASSAAAANKNLQLAHDAMRGELKLVLAGKKTFKEAVADATDTVLSHGIENVSMLFPEARTVGGATPQWISRRMEWVAPVINGTSKTPFSRVKTVWSDITADDARARGYVKGAYKREEWFGVQKRTTGPTTVYKKQKLDRDDVIDVEEFDLVAWMRGEMRVMIEEEIARAILLGDGRAVDDPDKIADPMAAASGDGIRSILNEHEYFAVQVNVNIVDSNSSYLEPIEEIVKARRFYKGSGSPTLFTTEEHLTNMLLLKDEANSNRRLFNTVAELASYLRVKEIVPVEVMEHSAYANVFGIIVNLKDYNIGASKGGELTNFDDFDINYNQYLYLIETRLSGALIMPFSALVIRLTATANRVVPQQPSFVTTTGVVTIPAQTGVVYKNADTDATLTAGAQTALTAGSTLRVKATPAATYYFPTSVSDGPWPYKRPAA